MNFYRSVIFLPIYCFMKIQLTHSVLFRLIIYNAENFRENFGIFSVFAKTFRRAYKLSPLLYSIVLRVSPGLQLQMKIIENLVI